MFNLIFNWCNCLKRVNIAMDGQYTEAHDIDSEKNKQNENK